MTSQAPLVTAIITAKDEGGSIERCISSVLEQDYSPFEVIVVDAASEDDTLEKARSFDPATVKVGGCRRYLPVSASLSSPAKARNFGAALAQGELLAFTDADCAPSRDWLSRLAGSLQQEGGIVGGPNILKHPIDLSRNYPL